ncbi:hypothetical protein VNO77_43648 [Canavalia gladiata]|uniref:Uncharacterized protein n=1 Tax=Canavalia gladiata TaxID=3824 RepID=A0AAN9JV68_CANGL
MDIVHTLFLLNLIRKAKSVMFLIPVQGTVKLTRGNSNPEGLRKRVFGERERERKLRTLVFSVPEFL